MRVIRFQPMLWLHFIQLALLMIAVGPTWAAYTGLVQIPTSATIGDGAYVVEPLYYVQPDEDISSGLYLGTEFGLGKRTELGIDFDLSANAQVYIDAKYCIGYRNKSENLAIGLYNFTEHTRPTPYLAGDFKLGKSIGTLGIQYDDDMLMWFVGASSPLTSRLEVEADYINNDEYALGLGATYVLTPRYALNLAVLIPNDHADAVGYELSVDIFNVFHNGSALGKLTMSPKSDDPAMQQQHIRHPHICR